MRNVRDSFVHFVADNIAQFSNGQTIPVVALFRSVANPDGEKFKTNSVNISFVGESLSPTVNTTIVELDVIQSDELTAVDWANSLWQLLSATFYTALKDYSQNPSAPVAQGTNIFWNVNSVGFKPIHDDYYFRYNCRLVLQSHG